MRQKCLVTSDTFVVEKKSFVFSSVPVVSPSSLPTGSSKKAVVLKNAEESFSIFIKVIKSKPFKVLPQKQEIYTMNKGPQYT